MRVKTVSVPHVIPYQGSKRKIAHQILDTINFPIKGKLYEPFAGSAAITLHAAVRKMALEFVIGDKYEPLIALWKLIVAEPDYVGREYRSIWNAQLYNPKEFYSTIRDEFNLDYDPIKFLYLVARCVKNAIRFNSSGDFNQSPDNRRLGMRPEKVEKEAHKIAALLGQRVSFRTGDFTEILSDAGEDDLVYMDPPWQGTSNKKDPRYAYLLELDKLIAGLEELNRKNVPYLLSFDGTCGDKVYGDELPTFLNLKRIGINAGRSSQATLLGRQDITVESLYLSPAFVEKTATMQDVKRNELFESV